jgi:hypothetical protein
VRSLCRRLAACWRLFANLSLVLRLVALAFLIAIYFSFDWVLLRKLLRSCTAFVLGRAGHHTASIGAGSELFLVVDSELFSITANCTYLDLFLTLAPFCWGGGLRLSTNVRRLTALAVAIFLGNSARVSLALHLKAKGVPWALAHTVPDKLTHCAAVSTFMIAAVRNDWDAA